MTDAEAVPSISTYARWSDMDFNAHMRNTAFLEVAEDCRMRYFADNGFPMSEFSRLHLGPVITEDNLRYRREIRLLEEARVTQRLAGLSADNVRFRLRNDVLKADGELAAVVTSTILWFDLAQRRPTPPPDDLAALVAALPRTDDFAEL